MNAVVPRKLTFSNLLRILFFLKTILFILLFCLEVNAVGYNSGFEIYKADAARSFKDFTMQFSFDLKTWNGFDKNGGMNPNYFYGGIRLQSDCEKVYLRFRKEMSRSHTYNPVSGTIKDTIITYLVSDIYSTEVYKKRTHFLNCEMSGITNNVFKSIVKNITYTSGKPPVYYYSIDLHYETITNGIENNSYQINIDNISQSGNTVHLDWSFPIQQPSIITYFVGIGFMSFGAFTNVPTTETYYTWMPQRTGKYWCMIRAEDSDNNSYFSEPVSFVYVDPNDSGEADSDNDGFNDIEELLRNSDPYDPQDMPVIILSDTNSVLEIRKDMYFYKELFVKKNLSVSWESVGILPAGMSFNEQGILSGVPEACGIFPIEINAYSMIGNHFDTISLNITVSQPEQSVVKVGTGEIKTNP